jgi:small-conductance mechanosensitive channel
MKKRYLTIAFTLLVLSIPLYAIVNGQPLTEVLKDLRSELKMVYEKSAEEQALFNKDYDLQHQRMINVITASNELSLLLYTQEQGMTFDLAYALQKVSDAYRDFSKDRRPYDRIVNELNIEVDRYARLIEALRRLPPVMTEIEIEILPDSLLYHIDSLDMQISELASSLEKEVIRIAIKDSLSSPFVLDEEGEIHRDSCILYASELLKQHASNRDSMIADSTHYQAAYWRMKEAYDYAQSRYRELERYVFVDGQTSFLDILADPRGAWKRVKVDLHNQYDFSELDSDESLSASGSESAMLESSAEVFEEEEETDLFTGLSSKGANSMLVLVTTIQLIALVIFWVLTFFILWLLSRNARIKRILPKNNLSLFSVLLGTILYFLVLGISVSGDTNEYIRLGAKHINTFLWLLIVISGSLLLRVKPSHIRHSLRLYIPTFIIGLIIIVCRITFVPDRLMNFLFPPILAVAAVRQLFFCIRESGKTTPIDSVLGWISLTIYLIALVLAVLGYTFIALLILIWWYFQLAVLLTIVCIADLMGRYKERWLDKRVDTMRNRITYVAGTDRESLLFGATWFYDFIRQVAIPTLFVISLPLCIHMSLDIFDFDDLYDKIFHIPFVQLFDKEGFETLRISGRSIIGLLCLFFLLRYFNRAIHAIWQYVRYATFMRKHNRTSIRNNEINLSLGNSIISVLVWMSYAIAVVAILRIPTGSLSLIAGGLSAGIGLALKDILNNFIYGIQLMGGRLRVGDWIECDGVRGKVVAINYQCVVVETLDGTEMSFLNASLFGKNFNNLTRNNSYEFTKIVVGVAYGTDVKRVRQVLVDAMQQMRTKDKYGRDIVDPQYGVYVVVDNMSDSSVDIAVKQYVLVAERIGYIDKSKEVLYEALNNAGISIPFPQCDVHLIQDDH